MRGKVEPYRRTAAYLGITPAYAGKSFQLGDVPAVQKDHPRLCGEKVEQRNIVIDTIGSPPPMRGKAGRLCTMTQRCRITPAYAGKRAPVVVRTPIVRDHPRLCGEKGIWKTGSKQLLGSPPPMRGKDLLVVQPCTADGITPAYAGKSLHVIRFFVNIQDHPRLCGEKAFTAGSEHGGRGSPPPMRGKDVITKDGKTYARITPAYAGKRIQ